MEFYWMNLNKVLQASFSTLGHLRVRLQGRNSTVIAHVSTSTGVNKGISCLKLPCIYCRYRGMQTELLEQPVIGVPTTSLVQTPSAPRPQPSSHISLQSTWSWNPHPHQAQFATWIRGNERGFNSPSNAIPFFACLPTIFSAHNLF